MKTLRWTTPVIAAAFAVTLLSGCTDVARALNKGGDTTCSEYLNQNADDQRMTITKAIKQQTGNDAEPAGTQVDITMASVQALCQVQANSETPIKNADIAGIFINK
ncbi:hypothetical protein JK358_33835 [Nocardia sp. 2]|uniref:Acid stress chaperone HdeA n=1 Tax=Nocardia acididurans TaxID=2802282 RepID=A0ABS1MGK6_9NOCA|nr:hypothetical protein [Nocardia acididurans]MBL1079399.1 hypothetical protein [Nocardia acididurans]